MNAIVTGSRRERRKAETKKRIISAAIQVLSERGIEEATVDEIASAADVGKGTIYNYFQTKEEIVVAFLIDIERKVQKRVPAFASAAGPLNVVLASFLEFQLKLKRPHYQFVRVFFAQMFARGSASSAWVRELQSVIDPPLQDFFSTLQRRGLIREDVAIQDLVQLFKMLHVGLMTTWVMEGPPWRATHRLLREQMRVFCEGVQRREKRSLFSSSCHWFGRHWSS